MALTGHAFLVLLVLATVGTPVLALLLWNRVRGRLTARTVQRLGMLVLCQVSALALVATLINNYFYFYASWSDLLGHGKIGTIQAVNPVPTSMTRETRIIAAARHNGQKVPGGGVVLSQTLVGQTTHLKTPALIYLPPQYFQPQYAHTKFPVALVFPGYPGNPPIYFTHLPMAQIMQQEVAAGRAQPFIAVVVKETPLAPWDTECANVPNGPQVETFLSHDVRTQISQVLRVRTDRQGWAMMGSSTGGFCSVKMVMQHPSQYATAVGLSGYYKALLDHTTGALYHGSKLLQNQNSPLWMLQNQPAPPVDVLATISKQDKTYPQTVALMHAVKPPMRLSAIVSPTGGHNLRTYGAVLPQVMDWLGKQFGPLGTGGSGGGSTTGAVTSTLGT